MDTRKVITLLKSGPSKEEMAAKADLVNGKVPASELPSYVDDVLEYEDFEHFPAEGEEGKIYVDIQTGDTYRWSGTVYVRVGGRSETMTPIPTLDIQRLFRTEYAIATNITNGSATGDSTIWTKETASVTISADAGYLLPKTITVSGATHTYDDATGAIALSTATGNVSISAACEPDSPAPSDLVKGDIIHFDALGDGTQKRFRVMKVDGNKTTLMSLDDSITSTFNIVIRTDIFDNGVSYQKYTDSALDSAINVTYYNSLSTDVKAAIVATNRIQSCYARTLDQSPDANADFNILRTTTTNYYAYRRIAQKTIGDRNCFALDIDDIKEYFEASTGDVINSADILNMFFEQTTRLDKDIWNASAHADDAIYASIVFGTYGTLGTSPYSNTNIVRPAFRINLSTIEYTKE